MKTRTPWLAVPLVLLSLGSCEKKTEPAPSETTPAAVSTPGSPEPTAPAPAPAPTVKALTADERAAKLGFVKHLPKDTEAVIAFYNGKKATERAKTLKLWGLIEEQMGMGMQMEMEPGELDPGEDIEIEEDMEIPDQEQDDAAPEDAGLPEEPAAEEPEMAEEDPAMEEEMLEPLGPGDLLGNEFTVALGKSAGEQTANLLSFYSRYGYFMYRGLSKAFVTAVKSGDPSGMQELMGEEFMTELGINLLNDPESGAALLDRSKMPPLYFAYRVDDDKRESALQQMASSVEFLGMFEDNVEPVDFEHAGGTFAGYRVLGAKLAESLGEDREGLDELTDPETVDKLLAAMAKKDLVVVTGILGEYVVLFVGSSKDDFQLVNTNSESLAANDSLAFSDAYATKDVAALIHGGKPALDAMKTAATGLADIAKGIRDGLGESDGLGDTRDLEAMLQIVAEREDALRKLSSNEALGLVAYFEEGLKIESHGGADNGALDYKTTPTLAGLGQSSDVVLFANMTVDAAYDEKAQAYFESIVETSYAMALKVSQVEMEVPEMEQFKEMFSLFDTKFRSDLVGLWDAYSGDFSAGVGQESALVVDLKGSMPAFPGVPQEVVDNGRFVRASMVMPVTDRAKIQDAWKKMNESTTSLLAKISEMNGEEIPMQKPISSEKDGFVTWFFSLPFTSDDFMPSVTLSDKWFIASTSKTQALELAAKAGVEAGTPRPGLWMDMNFVALQQYAKETLAMVEENSAAIFGENEFALNEFEENKELYGKYIASLDDLDKITVHTRREGGELRSSVHFKTR